MDYELLNVPHYALSNLHVLWTWVLLIIRFAAMITLLPGIGAGPNGLAIRTPAIIIFAAVSTGSGVYAEVPRDWGLLIGQVVSEVTLGLALGLIPLMIISGVQLAGNLASTTMGLQPSQLIDPTSQVALPDIARIWSDLAVIVFLFMGGHHVLIYAASGLGGAIVPGTFLAGDSSWASLREQTTLMWSIGIKIAAPVIVALMFTNFVMGLITKAVPTVNIFIVSFPLTIGIGLVLSILALPELLTLIDGEVREIEGAVLRVTADAENVEIPAGQ